MTDDPINELVDVIDLPPLPKAAGMIEVETSTSWNTFADAYTADQVRQVQREAYEAGRAAAPQPPKENS